MELTATPTNESSDVKARLIAAVQQLPQPQAAEALHYVEYLLEKYAKSKKPKRKAIDKNKPNPYLKLAGIAVFDKDYSPKDIDDAVYGL